MKLLFHISIDLKNKLHSIYLFYNYNSKLIANKKNKNVKKFFS